MGECRIGNDLPSEHSCNLQYSQFAIDRADLALHAIFITDLGYNEMLVCAGSNLRQVSDDENLSVCTQASEELAHSFGDGPSNAGVNFVEYESVGDAQLTGRHCNRQCDSG